ncbi:methyltransferase [Sphingomonas sp. CFBP 8760]|uniref:methyltransferase n=1 Tax=Sphingomonas sp. CFBP 8760 TaxID=2775282 RepID=UPI001782DFDF|nr:methyltransferase [Sphingomonas sp. CFBP 8760]MBD8548209.1 methyltransferase [Sphingomonas sp. CFBP 8760]
MAQILAERPIDTASPLRDIDPAAFHDLLDRLDRAAYRFVTVTPASHAHVVARPDRRQAGSLRDIFGWSLPFDPGKLPPPLFASLGRAGIIVERDDGRFVSRVRVSSVHDALFLHSAYPTTARDAVFLGPDSYRFADLILARMAPPGPDARILDYAAGAGVGGITAAIAHRQARLTLADINTDALFLAAINAARAGLDADVVHAATPTDVAGTFDLIVTHPPFMIDPGARAYRDGGDLHGARLSLDWVVAGAGKLAPGGRLILHTGVAIVDGEDVLRPHLEGALAGTGCSLWYHELDPDIFGEELATPAYADVERIAAVGACVVRGDR